MAVAVAVVVMAGAAAPSTSGVHVSDARLLANDEPSTLVQLALSNPGTMQDLFGVSCASGLCMAVGVQSVSNPFPSDQNLAEDSTDGTTWTTVPSPGAPNMDNSLIGVSCTSSSFCMAVGGSIGASSGAGQTLTEEWNGTTWSLVTSPTPPALNAYLTGVSCLSSSFCMAVGYSNVGRPYYFEGFAEEWDGSAWSLLSAPNWGASLTLSMP